MLLKFIKNILCFSLVFSVVACSSISKNGTTRTAETIASKENLYINTQNYESLISLYRDVLREKEDDLIRYKLASVYYDKGDSRSSLLYLTPLLKQNTSVIKEAKELQVKNLIQLKQYSDAISVANDLLSMMPSNGAVYNLRGIAFAQLGKLNNARDDINKAREFFINDVVAVNNLAMLSIINGDYNNAVTLLMPQYLNGIREKRLIHNLVFALVKTKDIAYAKDIILKERLNTSPDDLINALMKAEPVFKEVRR
ncbi:tetratricopeptide repeat protein [Pasteurella canis]|uniref:tetratricopeptide repeat protein n=1 Tax=Pasteurella canis TaxID=753 RepID=UPI001CBC30B0|nr:tetratricopeptide repeat protein [Pasteurella canis]UAX43002.1 tetratricopeptide repeat protein [Pasteurella canis]